MKDMEPNMHQTNDVRMVKIGKTNLEVSTICFGSASLSNMPLTFGYSVDKERGLAALRAIFDSPINFLDTSRNYGSGRSEKMIGEVIRERGGLPEGFVISTKLDRDMNSNRFDEYQAWSSLEQSLKTLGLDRIHLLHLHDLEFALSLDDITGPNGALAALFKMKEEGLAEAVGLAAGKVDIMMPILREWDFDALMTHNRHTLINRNADQMIDFAREKGTAILNAAPFCGGVLAQGSEAYHRYVYHDITDDILELIRNVEAVCAKHGIPTGAAALQFSMLDTRITSTICGVNKPEHIQKIIEWSQWPIEDDEWAELMALPFFKTDPEANTE